MVNILAALSTTLVVGRIIGPEEFGLAAIAYLLGSLAEVAVATPFADPLILRRRLDMSVVDAAFTAMTAAGIGMFLLILSVAPLLARLYDKPSVAALLSVQAVCCLFLGLRGAPEAILARKLRFKSLAVRNIIAKIIGALVSLVAALAGLGAWSIILGNVAFAVSCTLFIFVVTKRKPKILIRLDHVASLFSFGLFSLLDALLWTATPRVFSFFVGYFEGVRVLGELNIAFRINDTACALIGATVTRVALPMFSRVSDDRRRLERAFLDGTRLVCVIVGPVFLGLALTSREIVDVALGADWHLASLALVAVCLFSLFNFARLLAHPTVKATARPALLIGPDAVGLLYIAIGAIAFRHAGLGAQLAVWVSFGVVFLLCSFRMIQKAIGTSWLAQLTPLAPAVLPSLGMCTMIFGVAALHHNESPLTMLLLKLAVGGMSYLLLLAMIERPLLMQMLSGSLDKRTPAKLR